MPQQALDRLRQMMEQAMAGGATAEVTHIALMNGIAGLSDIMQRMAEQMQRTEANVQDVKDVVHQIDKRVLVIESNAVNARLDRVEQQVHDLELVQARVKASNDGQVSVLDAVPKYGPTIVLVIITIVLLVTKGMTSL